MWVGDAPSGDEGDEDKQPISNNVDFQAELAAFSEQEHLMQEEVIRKLDRPATMPAFPPPPLPSVIPRQVSFQPRGADYKILAPNLGEMELKLERRPSTAEEHKERIEEIMSPERTRMLRQKSHDVLRRIAMAQENVQIGEPPDLTDSEPEPMQTDSEDPISFQGGGFVTPDLNRPATMPPLPDDPDDSYYIPKKSSSPAFLPLGTSIASDDFPQPASSIHSHSERHQFISSFNQPSHEQHRTPPIPSFRKSPLPAFGQYGVTPASDHESQHSASPRKIKQKQYRFTPEPSARSYVSHEPITFGTRRWDEVSSVADSESDMKLPERDPATKLRPFFGNSGRKHADSPSSSVLDFSEISSRQLEGISEHLEPIPSELEPIPSESAAAPFLGPSQFSSHTRNFTEQTTPMLLRPLSSQFESRAVAEDQSSVTSTRSFYEEGDALEIYSKSRGMWYPGRVMEVSTNRKKVTVEFQIDGAFFAKKVKQTSKTIRRLQPIHSLRPIQTEDGENFYE